MHRIATTTRLANAVGIRLYRSQPLQAAGGSVLLRHFSTAQGRDDEAISNREITNHFDVLGLDRSFSIQPNILKSRYKDLMKQYHPDRLMSVPSDERQQKAQVASDVTRAHHALSSPLLRALHLLDLLGVPIEDSDSSIIDGQFLFEIMEVRESVDDASTDSQLKALLDPCNDKQADICEELATAFEHGDTETAKVLTSKLQYWSRVQEKITEKISCVS